MVLKRKRSDSELLSSPASASSSTSSSSFNSPPPAHTFSINVTPRAAEYAPGPAHLHSRTLKRFRGSKPNDEQVHQHTLSLLYGAQQQQPQSMPLPEPHMEFPQANSSSSSDNQQSLHRFWNIHSAPSTTDSSPSMDQQILIPTSCEDCGAGLEEGAGGDGMDVDGYGLTIGDCACGACGKQVCFSCSVSILGEQKRCLHCAGRKVWIGGIGWTSAGVSAC